MSRWRELWEALMAHPARFLYPQESPEYQQWLRENTQVAEQFHHQQYPAVKAFMDEIREAGRAIGRGVDSGLTPQEWERYRNFWCLV